MFESVDNKLESAKYFVDSLKCLERESGGVLASAKPYIVTALVDAFLFEVIAAKDLFLQEVNDAFGLGLSRKDVREQTLLCNAKLPDQPKEQVKELWCLLSDSNSWLWRLNNYRNAAAHRNIIKKRIVAVVGGTKEIQLFLDADPCDPLSKPMRKEIIPYCQESLTRTKDYLQKLYSGLDI
jgi:hypothetical protein